MLIRKPILERIKQGEVTLAFRRWRRPSVKAGSNLKTSLGLVSISIVAACPKHDITCDDARKAGYHDREELFKELNRREGDIYRIELSYGGVDPRIALRQDTELSDEDMRKIEAQFSRYDKASRHGDWTLKLLLLIKTHPMQPAGKLAEKAGFEKEWLKVNVRKLKNLGLTISHQPGYELSLRGHAFLERKAKRGDIPL